VTGFAADRGGSVADAFFGASPVVASALGIRSGATPRGPIHVTTPLRNDTLKPDISTLPELGHFYFALTPILSFRGDAGNFPKRRRSYV
jgi:hypothetical protein